MSNTPPMKRVIIVGANSFVASHFVHELLQNNYEVVALVRSNSEYSAQERMDQALIDTTLGYPTHHGRLQVLDYALLEEDFGLDDSTLKQIFNEDVDFYHFAASLKFDYQSREEIFQTNVKGLGNSLEVFRKFARHQDRFFFISTAYSCGLFSGVFKEIFYPEADISSFRNYYEQSKRYAEILLEKFISDHGISGHVIRLSQVVGNSQTGVTITDYGIFDFARRIHSLANEYPNQTIRILVDPLATQNLISIDTTVRDLMALIEKDHIPTILNFVANKAVQNQKIISYISDILPIDLIPMQEISETNMNKLEQMVLAGMEFTGNYIDTNIQFDTQNRDMVLPFGAREVSDESLRAMLSFYLGSERTQIREKLRSRLSNRNVG